jgi:hypothetical protein
MEFQQLVEQFPGAYASSKHSMGDTYDIPRWLLPRFAVGDRLALASQLCLDVGQV